MLSSICFTNKEQKISKSSLNWCKLVTVCIDRYIAIRLFKWFRRKQFIMKQKQNGHKHGICNKTLTLRFP